MPTTTKADMARVIADLLNGEYEASCGGCRECGPEATHAVADNFGSDDIEVDRVEVDGPTIRVRMDGDCPDFVISVIR